MLTRMRRLIVPPVFVGDAEKTQAAEVLNAVLLAMLAGCLLYGLIISFVAAGYVRRLVIDAVLIIWLLGMLLLSRRGYVRLASSATIVGLWVILTLTAASDGGVRSPAFGGYMIAVLGAGLLLGLAPAIGVAIASSVAGLAFIVAMRASILPGSTGERGDTLSWLVGSAYLVVAAALVGRATRSINRALERARRELAERRQAEAALRQSEALLRGIVDNTPALIYIKRHDGRFLLVNRQFEKLFNTTLEQLGDKTDYDFFPPEVADVFRANDQRVLATGAAIQLEEYAPHADGRLTYVSAKFPLFDAAGEPYAICGISTDITDRQRTEDALRRSEERYRMLSGLMSDYAYAYHFAEDGTTVMDWLTDAFKRVTGYEFDEVNSLEDWERIVHPEDLAIVRRRRQRLSDGHADVSEHRIVAKDGRLVWLRLYDYPLWDVAHTHVTGVYGAAQDITAFKQLELQLTQAQKMEAIGRLAGGVAHDFNNILTVILSNSAFLLDAIGQEQAIRQDVEQIQDAAARAAELTQQLLTFSRQQILQPHMLNLNTVVGRMQKLLRPLIGEHIELLTRLQPALEWINADPGRVEQVVMNLVINARDAMPNGGTLILETANVLLDEAYAREHVDVRAGPYVMLAISDTGSGMDAATRARIFEPFFTTKAQGKGTGLGLATVHGIVNQSGGHIWVYSEPGHGTSFKIYLPRAAGVAEAPRPARAPAALPTGSATILLVEDERSVRELAGRILRRQGYQILEAADGQSALSIAGDQATAIDLLLTDVVMPGGFNGRQLAEQLLSQRPGLKVLYMSGYTDDTITHYGVLDADVAYLQKPFTPEALIRKVHATLVS